MNRIGLLINRLQAARGWTKSLMADIEDARWFEAPAPGVGHVAWQVGHLAASQIALIHVRCCGMTFADAAPDGFIKTFGRGSTPVSDANAYPPLDEIRSRFERIHDDVIARVSAMNDGDLDAPAGSEPHPMFKSKAEAIAMAAMHESFHAGQIALMRRLWGKAPLR